MINLYEHGLLEKARNFAIEAHGDKKYSLEYPYVKHLDDVADILKPYGIAYQIVGYLHDIKEDTQSGDLILEMFGEEIDRAVSLCTDAEGKSRKERKPKTNAKLKAALLPDDIIGLVVKPADRLANMRESLATNIRLFKMYVSEYPDFRDAAYRDGLCDEFWEEMDSMASPIVESQQTFHR